MRVCLFDIDGTLIRSGGAGKAAMHAALTSGFGIARPNDEVPMSGRTDRAIVRDYFDLHEIEQSPENWQVFLRSYLEHLPSTLAARTGRVLPGIADLLDRLSARPRTAVGLLTGNVREGAERKLSHFGLFHHFPFGGFGDWHLDRADVAREALAAVYENVGDVPPERIWVIGDTPLDVACARVIGVRVAVVATGDYPADQLVECEPDLLIEDLSDVRPLWDALCRA